VTIMEQKNILTNYNRRQLFQIELFIEIISYTINYQYVIISLYSALSRQITTFEPSRYEFVTDEAWEISAVSILL